MFIQFLPCAFQDTGILHIVCVCNGGKWTSKFLAVDVQMVTDVALPCYNIVIVSYKATYQLLHAPHLEYLRSFGTTPSWKTIHACGIAMGENRVKGGRGDARVSTTTFVTCIIWARVDDFPQRRKMFNGRTLQVPLLGYGEIAISLSWGTNPHQFCHFYATL